MSLSLFSGHVQTVWLAKFQLRVGALLGQVPALRPLHKEGSCASVDGDRDIEDIFQGETVDGIPLDELPAGELDGSGGSSLKPEKARPEGQGLSKVEFESYRDMDSNAGLQNHESRQESAQETGSGDQLQLLTCYLREVYTIPPLL